MPDVHRMMRVNPCREIELVIARYPPPVLCVAVNQAKETYCQIELDITVHRYFVLQ